MSDANAHEFKEGEVWTYRTRPGESTSTLLINKIESKLNFGQVFHISVRGVSIKNPRAPGGVTTNLPHFPVSRKTLEDSALELVRSEVPDPCYLEGYEQWKQAFESGKAGVFTISVAEIVGVIEQTVNR
ncbi:MAG: hypothetical protein JNN30_13825 [Rhodanobacteraceae bacterium]|nr:hypothetical protein [Rhodanobacteraceae bacterium]